MIDMTIERKNRIILVDPTKVCFHLLETKYNGNEVGCCKSISSKTASYCDTSLHKREFIRTKVKMGLGYLFLN